MDRYPALNSMRYKNPLVRFSLFSFVLFSALTIYITYPLLFHLNDFTTGMGDELFIAWAHSWVLHAFAIAPFQVFTAPIYFPFHHSFAYSDGFFTTSILSFIPLLFLKEPIVAVNTTLISSLILLGFSTSLLSYKITKNTGASLLSGILLICSPALLDKKVHLQILSVYWVPFSILFFLLFLEKEKIRYLIFSLLCFLLQTYNSFLPGIFLVFFYGIFLLVFRLRNKGKIGRILDKNTIFCFILTGFTLIPIIIPYYQNAYEYNAKRDIRDAIHFALQPEDLLVTNTHSRLEPLLSALPFSTVTKYSEIKPGFFGLMFSLLSLITIFYLIKNFIKLPFSAQALFSVSMLSLILSFGPALHLGRVTIHEPFFIPLPYAVFYYLLPGFAGFRNSARWEIFFLICITVLIAFVISMLLKNRPIKIQFAIYLVSILATIGEYKFPMQFLRVPQRSEFPKIHSFFQHTPLDTAYIEMPIYNWNMTPFAAEELKREYYMTSHFRRSVNGYSGFSPPEWQQEVEYLLQKFPSDKSLTLLKKKGVIYIVVHVNEYDTLASSEFKINGSKIMKGKSILEILLRSSKVKQIARFDKDYIFTLKEKKL